MLALRFVALLAVALWIGGLVVLGIVAAPAIFDVTAWHQVADGRQLSGAIFGEAFRRFHLVAYVCGAVVLLSLAARALLGPRPRRFALRSGIALVMLATALYSGLVVSGHIERLRQEIGAAPSSLTGNDPRRLAFGRLHRQSTLLQVVPLLGGLLLMFWELKD
jgi:hypothetical protein